MRLILDIQEAALGIGIPTTAIALNGRVVIELGLEDFCLVSIDGEGGQAELATPHLRRAFKYSLNNMLHALGIIKDVTPIKEGFPVKSFAPDFYWAKKREQRWELKRKGFEHFSGYAVEHLPDMDRYVTYWDINGASALQSSVFPTSKNLQPTFHATKQEAFDAGIRCAVLHESAIDLAWCLTTEGEYYIIGGGGYSHTRDSLAGSIGFSVRKAVYGT